MSVVRNVRAFQTLTVARPKSTKWFISVGENRGFHERKPTPEYGSVGFNLHVE